MQKKIKTVLGGLLAVTALAGSFAAGRYEAALRQHLAGLFAPRDDASRPQPVLTPPVSGVATPLLDNTRPDPTLHVRDLQALADLDQGQADYVAALKRATKVTVGADAAALRQQALAAAQRGQLLSAIQTGEEALALGETTLWLPLADWRRQNQDPGDALRLGWQAYRAANDAQTQAKALRLVADILEAEDRADLALTARQEAQRLAPDPATQRQIDLATGKLFAVVRVDTQTGQDTPSVCASFPVDLIAGGAVDYRNYVSVTPPRPLAVFPQGKTLCIEGLSHGETATLVFRAGLPGANGGRLEADATEQVTLSQRPPFLAFPEKTYILPRLNNAGVPLVSVNLDQANLRLLRIVDRNLPGRVGQVGNRVWDWEVSTIDNTTGEEIWHGTVKITSVANRQVRTAIPLQTLLPKTTPGVYLLTAAMPAEIKSDTLTSQWLVVTDIGLSSVSGADGLHVAAQSYATGKPLAGIRLQLMARNNKILAETVTDAAGRARFAAGLVRATGGNTPQLVTAYGPNDEFSYLPLETPAFDLSDRGVTGRETPQGLDAFLYGDRDIYRPGETAHVVGLIRDADGRTPATLPPLTLRLLRPDGVLFRETTLPPEAGHAGGYAQALTLPDTARTGRWQVMLYADPKGAPIGTLGFMVEDFVPARLAVKLSSAAASLAASLAASTAAAITVQADYLYGAAGANLAAQGEVVVRKAEQPFAAFPRFRFGAVDATFTDQREELPATRTDVRGQATLSATLPTLAPTTLPLEALIRATVFEEGGRPTSRTMILPVQRAAGWIGIAPQFDDSVDAGSAAVFDIITLTGGGQPTSEDLRYQLLREEYDYFWYSEDSAANYRRTVKTRLEASGSLTTATAAATPLTVRPRDYGTYRLEVVRPGQNGDTVLSSVRFQVGWGSDDRAEVPETLRVMADRQHYRPGETARLTVASPFSGPALLTLARDGVLSQERITLQQGDNTLTVPVTDRWGTGIYAIVTGFRPGGGVPEPTPKDGQRTGAPSGPGRAIGLSWLGIDPAPRTLTVSLDVPASVTPEQTLTVPLRIVGTRPGVPTFVTLAAVDEGVLQLTDFATPDPEGYFYGKRRLAVDLRDSYGKLIDPRYDTTGEVRSGGDAAGRQAAGLPDRWIKPLALFSGIVPVAADGTAAVPLTLPQFNGKVRLMATAWTADSVGHAEAPLLVRAPVVLTSSLPRFFAAGDQSRLTLSARNVAAVAGDYTLKLATTGGLKADAQPTRLTLSASGAAQFLPTVTATAVGPATLTATLTGPDGAVYRNSFALTVRPIQPLATTATRTSLAPGATLTLDPAQLWGGHSPWQASVRLTASSTVNFGLAGLLEQLSRYPYGCLEQTLSRAFPLVYVTDLTQELGLKPENMQAGIAQATTRLSELQRDDGAFGLWDSFSTEEPWLTAYAADFLQRASAQGYAVPPFLLRGALDWLKQKVIDADFERNDLSMYAYAFAVLTQAQAIDPAAVRYFYDTWFDRLPNRMAAAHLAAALVRINDTRRAEAAFARIEAGLKDTRASVGTSPYGSVLSDLAAVVTLATEAGLPQGKILPLADQLAQLKAATPALTTQEQAWLIAANHALLRNAAPVSLTTPTGTLPPARLVTAQYTPDTLPAPLTVKNTGTTTALVDVQASAYPDAPLPAVANGFSIERQFYTLDGQPLPADQVRQNTMVVVVIKGQTTGTFPRQQAMVVDLLPAGFEIENAAFGSSKAAEELSWLPALSTPAFQDRRDDRYVAALSLGSHESFALAYLVRAVTPGRYTLPPVLIEDLYRLELKARTTPGQMTVLPAE